MINECKIVVIPEIPEHVEMYFDTTGFQGGDTGHGGSATLTIKWEGGDHEIEVGENSITLTARGDWEIEGLVCALAELGELLSKARK